MHVCVQIYVNAWEVGPCPYVCTYGDQRLRHLRYSGSLVSELPPWVCLASQLAPRTASLCHLLRTVNTVRGHYAHRHLHECVWRGPKPCPNTPKTCMASVLHTDPSPRQIFSLLLGYIQPHAVLEPIFIWLSKFMCLRHSHIDEDTKRSHYPASFLRAS